jgi:TRAP transporter 4TM/12TM fusion protein
MDDESKNKIREKENNPEKKGLPKFWKNIAFILGVTLSVNEIYFVYFRPITPWILYTTYLCFGIVITLILYPAKEKSIKTRVPLYDIILILLAIGALSYFALQTDTIIYRAGVCPTTGDIIAGIIVILLVLEITRRTLGMILVYLAVSFLLYCRYGSYLPGIIGHRGYSWSRIISYIPSLTGIFSTPIVISASYVYLFILFAAFMYVSGTGQFFIDFALSIAGGKRGGPAKVAVVASALFGTISGSSSTNVVSTGAFTIPLMKSIGYKNYFAGAVEAVASTGGQIMPPILGSAAFIIAELAGVSYLRVVIASIIPALLYFGTVFIMIDLEAIKLNLKGVSRELLKDPKKVILNDGYLVLPVFILIFVLVIMRASPVKAAVYSIFSVVICANFKKQSRMGFNKILKALNRGATTALGLIAACATAGIVIGALNLTGMGIKLTSIIIAFSGGKLWLGLILTMVSSIILGMGMPTTAAYLVCAAVIAPSLIEMGTSPLAAHMFVFFFAILSAITPPVALAAYAASALANAKPMKIAFTACKLGITAFIIPFIFMYNPVMLMEGSAENIVILIIRSLIAIIALASGIQGRFFAIKLNFIEAIIFLIIAFLLLINGTLINILAFVVMGCFVYYLYYFKEKRKLINI